MSEIIICLFGGTRYDRSCQGLAGAGRQLADQLGTSLRAVVIGAGAESLAEEVASVVDSITVVDQPDLAEYQPEPYLTALTELFSSLSPRAVLLSNDAYSQELTPRLAHRLNGSAVGDGIAVTPAGDRLRVVRQVYGGKAQATMELKRTPAVIWLRARSFAAPLPRSVAAEITVSTVQVNDAARTRVVERKREESGCARGCARVIVSGGRGIGGPEPFTSELLPLADLMVRRLRLLKSARVTPAGRHPPGKLGRLAKKSRRICTSRSPSPERVNTWPESPKPRTLLRLIPTQTRRSSNTAASVLLKTTGRLCRCCAKNWRHYRNERRYAPDLLEHLPDLGHVCRLAPTVMTQPLGSPASESLAQRPAGRPIDHPVAAETRVQARSGPATDGKECFCRVVSPADYLWLCNSDDRHHCGCAGRGLWHGDHARPVLSLLPVVHR